MLDRSLKILPGLHAFHLLSLVDLNGKVDFSIFVVLLTSSKVGYSFLAFGGRSKQYIHLILPLFVFTLLFLENTKHLVIFINTKSMFVDETVDYFVFMVNLGCLIVEFIKHVAY